MVPMVSMVRITRLSPRRRFFDSDNNAIALKHVRDLVARVLRLPDDADHKEGAVQWQTERQESELWGVVIEFFSGSSAPTRTYSPTV